MAELCPKGAYTGRVLKQGLFESAGKGTLEFKVWVEVFRSADHGDLPRPFRRTAVEYICARLSEVSSRATAWESLRRDIHGRPRK